MKNIEINIGKACNCRCIFCMSSITHKRIFADFQEVKTIISKYRDLGYESIGFLGGEITIHPQVLDIIRHCKDLGFKQINLVTNGIRLQDSSFMNELVESGVTRINMSVHSHLSEIEDFLTQVPGGLNKKIKAIKNAVELFEKGLIDQPPSINIVLNKANVETILETAIYFFSIGVRDIRINFLWPHKSTIGKYNSILLKYEDAYESIKKLIYFSLIKKLRISFDSIPYCVFNHLYKADYGKISQMFMGEKQDGTINEVENPTGIKDKKIFWREIRKDSLKGKDEKCKNCKEFNDCEGIWTEYIEQFGFNEFDPIK